MPSNTDLKPIFFSPKGIELDDEERKLFAEEQPFGFILVKRNFGTPDEVKSLVADLRQSVGRKDAPVFIDQEGGRVARLAPPYWPALPALRKMGLLYEQSPEKAMEAARLQAAIISGMLHETGFTGNFAPVLDLYIEGASIAIGDRALSPNPDIVAALGSVFIETYLAHGILPVIKHMPGHGRVLVDPHEKLPRVKASLAEMQDDFIPFQKNNTAPFGMNCHVVFDAIDAELPVSLSPKAHKEVIRGTLGFKGILFSDDLAMGALEGSRADLAQQALEAGADILLYCKGDSETIRAISQKLPPLSDDLRLRWAEACDRREENDEKSYNSNDLTRLETLLSAG